VRFQPDKCPECAEEPAGTVEKVHGLATLTPDGQGGYDYSGHTEVWWNDQQSVTDGEGRVLLQCARQHEWYAVKE
jgi:hypothetical protein